MFFRDEGGRCELIGRRFVNGTAWLVGPCLPEQRDVWGSD